MSIVREATVLVGGVPTPVRIGAVTEEQADKILAQLGEQCDPVKVLPREPESVKAEQDSWVATPDELHKVAAMVWGTAQK